DPWVAAADPEEFAAGWSALDVGIDELDVPGVLGGDTTTAPQIGVRLAAVSLVEPYVQLTRTPEGLILPPLSTAPASEANPAGAQIEVNGKDIALQPFNPYATAYSPYSISSGGLAVTTRARFRKGRYDSTTALKLLKFDLGGKEGDTLFAQQFGIPLSVALALLKDLQGN